MCVGRTLLKCLFVGRKINEKTSFFRQKQKKTVNGTNINSRQQRPKGAPPAHKIAKHAAPPLFPSPHLYRHFGIPL